MSTQLIFALVCAGAAILYGVFSVQWILAKPSGNARMQEIASAIQEGANAYLNRQYTTIGMAGIVVLLLIGFFIGWPTAIGFAIGFDRLAEIVGQLQLPAPAGIELFIAALGPAAGPAGPAEPMIPVRPGARSC